MITCLLATWEAWPEKPQTVRQYGRFKVDYRRLLEDLDAELDKLDATDVVLQLRFPALVSPRKQARAYDGWPKADVKPASPGVILCFEGRYGPQQFPCDTYLSWDDNLRAISLTLERLRDIARYGAAARGQQYRGWTALPTAPKAEEETPTWAATVIARAAGDAVPSHLLRNAAEFQAAFRKAAMNKHPDRGGSTAEMAELNRAGDVLRKYHGI